MNKFTQKWTIVSTLEAVALDTEFSYKDWPEHITLADIFTVSWYGNNLIRDIVRFASNQVLIDLIPKGTTYFGSADSPIPVITYEYSDSLTLLHSNIVKLLLQHNAVFDNPTYINEGYIAHRTLTINTSIPIS